MAGADYASNAFTSEFKALLLENTDFKDFNDDLQSPVQTKLYLWSQRFVELNRMNIAFVPSLIAFVPKTTLGGPPPVEIVSRAKVITFVPSSSSRALD